MPLLDPSKQNSTPVQPVVRQTDRIISTPRQMVVGMIQQWEQSFDLLWSNQAGVTPAERLATIGTSGAELMQRSGDLVTFLLTQLNGEDQVLSERIQSKVAGIPEIKVGEDGTVSLT